MFIKAEIAEQVKDLNLDEKTERLIEELEILLMNRSQENFPVTYCFLGNIINRLEPGAAATLDTRIN